MLCPCNCKPRPLIDALEDCTMIVYDGNGERLVASKEAAERADITLRTFHNYHQTGRAPKPDGWVGRTPLWRNQTIAVWVADRQASRQRKAS